MLLVNNALRQPKNTSDSQQKTAPIQRAVFGLAEKVPNSKLSFEELDFVTLPSASTAHIPHHHDDTAHFPGWYRGR